MIRIGTSSWADPEFVRDWYPPKLPAPARLGWYAQHFDYVEVNSTFYAIPVKNIRLALHAETEAAGLSLEQPDGGVSQAGAHSRNNAACPCVAPSTTTIHTTAPEMPKRGPSFAIRTPS